MLNLSVPWESWSFLKETQLRKKCFLCSLETTWWGANRFTARVTLWTFNLRMWRWTCPPSAELSGHFQICPINFHCGEPVVGSIITSCLSALHTHVHGEGPGWRRGLKVARVTSWCVCPFTRGSFMQDCKKELDFSRLPAAKVFFHPPPFFFSFFPSTVTVAARSVSVLIPFEVHAGRKQSKSSL